MQLKAGHLKGWRETRLKQNDGRCELCAEPILPGQAVADHCHQSGHLRGVIHRACNSVLGKVENGRRYGRNFNPIAFAQGLHAYLTREKTLPLHPSHGKPKRKRK